MSNELELKDIMATIKVAFKQSLSTTITLDVLGDYRMQKGVKFKMEDNKLGINSICQITKSEHRIEGNVERVKVTIDIVKDIKENQEKS